jgi:hypothetical protein
MGWPEAFRDVVEALAFVLALGFMIGSININIGKK